MRQVSSRVFCAYPLLRSGDHAAASIGNSLRAHARVAGRVPRMAGRMSNRERIERLRAEADAAEKEKAAAKAAKPALPPKARKSSSKAQPPARVRIVWLVCDPSGKEVKRFPNAQEQEARADAQQQSAATGRSYFVMQADAPYE